ncbi:MAG: MCE family protein [Thermoanaerobaculum sp.]|nr:MCE family protein [Thermoanaerobaculum sp.]MDW7967854.1 MlaD family protein [Thermoanaerobaculum sp.]
MSQTAKVGAFMFVALVILAVFIIKIEEIPFGERAGRQRIQAEFPSVAGLDEKSPVRIAGVRVGIVERIELAGEKARVTLSLDPQVRLRRGAWAEVTSLGLLGDKYVELYPGPAEAPPLPPGTVLSGESPVAFDHVLKTAAEVGGDVKEVAASLRHALGGEEGTAKLNEILENIRQLTAETRKMVSENRAQLTATVANFRDFSATLKEELPKLAEKLHRLADRVDSVVGENRENLSDTIANLKDLSSRLRVSADHLNAITGRIAKGEGTIGKLVNDEETVNNLNNTLKSVESGVQSLRNTLGRAERWRLEVNLRTETLPGADDSRSAFGFDLHTTEKRFFRLELVDSPYGRVRHTEERVTTTFPDGRRETYLQVRQKVTDASTVNAQIGYHLGSMTIRAGLFESQGGFAVDQRLWQNRLKLSLEAYDFNREVKPPHLRLEGRYFLTPNIFAFAGWDDPRWSARSSLLVGAGITWRDEDLKYLLGTAASFGGR